MGRKGQGRNFNKISSKCNEKDINQHVDDLLKISSLPQQINTADAFEIQKEISLITEKIKRIQTNETSILIENRVSSTIKENFMQWVIENGALLKDCEITEFEGFELGLKATTHIPASSIVIVVPRKLIFSVETVCRSDLKKLIQEDQILRNMPNVALAILLLYEKFKEISFWRPYLDILPQKYTTVLYFSPSELEELKGSPTLDTSLKQIRSIARQYAYFHKLFNSTYNALTRVMRKKFTFQDYCWAVSTVMTRQNTIPSEENQQQMTNALIPLWDICNHTNGIVSTDYNVDLKQCECLAFRDFKAGEQFFIFYGARTNAELFVHNGFVFEENEHDGYWIKLGISKSDVLYQKRNDLLKKLSLQPTNEFFLKKGVNVIDRNLLSFLRIFNMNESELNQWLESESPETLKNFDCCDLDTLDKKSFTFLHNRLKLLLAMHTTTSDEDLRKLKDSNLNPNRRLAIKVRLLEKKLLNSLLEYIDRYIKE